MFKHGRFTKGAKGEDGKIIQNWENLIREAQIQDPMKCMRDLGELKLKGGTVLNLRKRNVLGCYLAQGLKFVRLCAHVLQRAIDILLLWTEGKFTKEEDATILCRVEEFGANPKTWNLLLTELNRRKLESIVDRHTLLTKGKEAKFGKWSKSDYEVFFKSLFKNNDKKYEDPVDFVNSLSPSAIYNGGLEINRLPKHVYQIWRNTIKPALLSYHNGTLHQKWKKDFYELLIESKVEAIQEIDWDAVMKKFPAQNPTSLGSSLVVIRRDPKISEMPVHLALQDYLQKLNHSKENETSKCRRELIVFCYDKARIESH